MKLLAELEEKLGPAYDARRAQTYHILGGKYRLAGDLEAADESYRDSIQLLLSLIEMGESEDSTAFDLAKARLALAHVLSDSGKKDVAREFGEAAHSGLIEAEGEEAARLLEEADGLLRNLDSDSAKQNDAGPDK